MSEDFSAAEPLLAEYADIDETGLPPSSWLMTSRTTGALSSCAYLAPPTVSILPTRGKNGPCPRDARQPNLVVQRERFVAQSLAAANGDPEAMVVDEDFLVAMEQGLDRKNVV